MKTIRRLMRYAKPWHKNMAATVFSLLAVSFLGLVTPAAVRCLTAALSDMDSMTTGKLLTFALVLFGTYLLRAVFRFVAQYEAHVGAWSFVGHMLLLTYDKLQKLSLKFYSDKQTGEIMSRAINDTRNLEQLFAHALPDLISNVITIAGVSVMLFTINAKLAALTLIPLPFVFYVSSLFSKKIAPLFRKNQELLAEINADVQDNISGIKEIQAFARETQTYERLQETAKRYVAANIRANFANALLNPSIEFLTSMGSVIVMGLGGALAMHGQLQAADIVGFFMYLSLFFTPLQTFARIVEDIQTGLSGGQRVLEILDTESDVQESPDARAIGIAAGDIAFRNVTFSYKDGETVLDNISFTADRGKTVAFVGATGVGKTTIVSLLERFYDPDSGSVLLDGQDIRELTLHSLRSNISIVLQDVFLFNGTVYDNIAYGNPNATREQVIAASKAAHADDFIKDMPDGYETKIGERGTKLSGGQKQRIAIARAVLRNTPVLILDEATSAVDNETEALIQDAINNISRNRTVIVIAHRLTTVMHADEIIVLEKGRIAERGTHRQLLEKNGIYAGLCGAVRTW
ncbi:MAG: ABC transporter ATP-binding protein [Clostridia bacterium]|nr:ABC transporter ATP-binding protein [Clostridia bacterium]